MGQPALIVLGALLVLISAVLISVYNSLVRLRQRVRNSWAQVDVQLRRRYDLIPNLVDTIKSYIKHEESTFEKVTKARNMAIAAGSVSEQIDADNMLTGALRSMFAVAEAYPDLKSGTNYLQLQKELTETESKIGFSRQFYNDTVMKYNTKIEVFPSRIVAGMFGFTAMDYFNLQGEAEARQPVRVNF